MPLYSDSSIKYITEEEEDSPHTSPPPGRAVQRHSMTAQSASRELWKNKTLARTRKDDVKMGFREREQSLHSVTKQ